MVGTIIRSSVIFLSILLVGMGYSTPLVYAQPNVCAECITPATPVFGSPLSEFTSTIACGYEPIVASTAVKKTAFPKIFAQLLSQALPRISDKIESRPINPGPVPLLLPSPTQLRFLMPLAKYAAKYGNDVIKIVENMNSEDIEALCRQEDKKVCYAVMTIRAAKKIGNGVSDLQEKAQEAMRELNKKCESIPLDFFANLCKDLTPGTTNGGAGANYGNEGDSAAVRFLKGLLVPYHATPKNTVLNQFNLADLNVQADPRQPNLYYARIAIDEIGLNGNLDVATVNPPKTEIIKNSAWDVKLKPGKRVYVSVPMVSRKQPDGSYQFSILPSRMNVALNNEDFAISSRTDPSQATPFSVGADALVSMLSQELLGKHSDLISKRVTEVVADVTGKRLNPILNNIQNNLVLQHPLMPSSVQRALLDSMVQKETKNLDEMKKQVVSDDKNFRDLLARSKGFLRNVDQMLSNSPHLGAAAEPIMEGYQKRINELIEVSKQHGGAELSWRRNFFKVIGVNADFAKSHVDILEGLAKKAEILKNRAAALKQTANDPVNQAQAATKVRFFEDPEHPDYLFMGAATCPDQGRFLNGKIPGEHPVQFVSPRLDREPKPDFSVAVTEASVNSYLKRVYEFGMFDAAVTGKEDIRSVKFLKEPIVEVGPDGKMSIRIKAAFDKAGVPDIFTNNVDVKLDVDVTIAPDQQSLQITPSKTSVRLNVRNRQIESYLSEMVLKIPANLFLPLAKPSNEDLGAQISSNARLPATVTNRVSDLKLQSEKGQLFLSGNVR